MRAREVTAVSGLSPCWRAEATAAPSAPSRLFSSQELPPRISSGSSSAEQGPLRPHRRQRDLCTTGAREGAVTVLPTLPPHTTAQASACGPVVHG